MHRLAPQHDPPQQGALPPSGRSAAPSCGERTRFFLIAATLVWFLGAPSAIAEDPTPQAPVRVLLVRTSDASAYRAAEVSCRTALEDSHQTIDSCSLTTWKQWAAADDCDDRADLFIAIGSKAARTLASQLPEEARLIYCLVSDPGRVGLTDRKRTWGVSTQVAAAQRIALLESALPGKHRIGVLHSPTEQGRARVEEMRRHLPEGWELEAQETVEKNFLLNLSTLLSRKPTVFIALPDSKVFTKNSSRVLLKETYRAKIPVFGYSKGFVEAGALLGTAIDPAEQGERAGELVGVALASPGDSPPVHESPTPTPHLNVAVLEILDLNAKPDFLKRSDVCRIGRGGRR